MAGKPYKRIFLISLIITISIFFIGSMMSYGLDFLRLDKFFLSVRSHELDTESYIVEQDFVDTFGADKCEFLAEKMVNLKQEIRQVGKDLTLYGRKSFFMRKDFDYLKRKYFILELKFLTLVNDLNQHCEGGYIPLLFFYEIDDDLSERQGYILDEISKGYDQKIVILSFDKDYEDEPSLNLLKGKYNISIAPTIVFDGIIIENIAYTREINASISTILKERSN